MDDGVIVIMRISKAEIEKLQEAIGYIGDVDNADSDDIALSIHTLIDVCM